MNLVCPIILLNTHTFFFFWDAKHAKCCKANGAYKGVKMKEFLSGIDKPNKEFILGYQGCT